MVCSICLEECNKPFMTSCNHTFHVECIEEWYKKDNTCPICRKKQPGKLEQLYSILQKNKNSDVRQVLNYLQTDWNELLK